VLVDTALHRRSGAPRINELFDYGRPSVIEFAGARRPGAGSWPIEATYRRRAVAVGRDLSLVLSARRDGRLASRRSSRAGRRAGGKAAMRNPQLRRQG